MEIVEERKRHIEELRAIARAVRDTAAPGRPEPLIQRDIRHAQDRYLLAGIDGELAQYQEAVVLLHRAQSRLVELDEQSPLRVLLERLVRFVAGVIAG